VVENAEMGMAHNRQWWTRHSSAIGAAAIARLHDAWLCGALLTVEASSIASDAVHDYPGVRPVP
jgi:hypothetical protein